MGGLYGFDFRVLGSEFVPVVVSCGPRALLGFVCGNGSLDFALGWWGVSSAFQHGRTGQSCKHAYATEKGGECEVDRRFMRGISVGVYIFFLHRSAVS